MRVRRTPAEKARTRRTRRWWPSCTPLDGLRGRWQAQHGRDVPGHRHQVGALRQLPARRRRHSPPGWPPRPQRRCARCASTAACGHHRCPEAVRGDAEARQAGRRRADDQPQESGVALLGARNDATTASSKTATPPSGAASSPTRRRSALLAEFEADPLAAATQWQAVRPLARAAVT